MTTFPYCKVHI